MLDDANAFDPATWRDAAVVTLAAAGARSLLSTRPDALSLEWPVAPGARSITIDVEHQEGGTLIVVRLSSWQPLPTPANRQLVSSIIRHLCNKTRDDTSSLDVQWQYASEDATRVAFSLDDAVHADTAEWRERILASVRRLEQIFVAVDPLMKEAAAGVFHAGAAHVVFLGLEQRLARRPWPAVVARLREAFPAITEVRLDDDGVVRAIRLEGAPETALLALDQPLLADVDEVMMYFDDDAVARFLAAGPLPRTLRHVEIVALDAQRLDIVAAMLARFSACTHLSLHLDDEERFRDVDAAAPGLELGNVVPVFSQLETLEIECDASDAVESTLLALLFAQPLPKLRRFTLDSHGWRGGPSSLKPLLRQLPSTVTELGLWQQPLTTWTALREALLRHEVMVRLTAVGVRDDVDEISDPRLADKKLFGPRRNAGDVAHDLHEVGRHADVVDMLGPLRWKSRDPDLLAHYATSLVELDGEAGVVAWRAVLAMSPKHAIATHNLANQLMAMGRLEEAHPVVVAALALEPDDPWMLRSLAVISQHRGDTTQTRQWAERFIQAASAAVVDGEADGGEIDGATRYMHACAQMWAGLVDVALETLEEAITAGLQGVTPDVDVEWDPLRADPRWQRLFRA